MLFNYAEVDLSEEEKRKFIDDMNIDTEEADLLEDDFNFNWRLRRYVEDSDFPWELYIHDNYFDCYTDEGIKKVLGYTIKLIITKTTEE